MKFADIAPPPHIFWHIEPWLTSFVLNVILRSVAFVYVFKCQQKRKVKDAGRLWNKEEPMQYVNSVLVLLHVTFSQQFIEYAVCYNMLGHNNNNNNNNRISIAPYGRNFRGADEH